ncbi:MAG: hypothetical protein KAW14_06065 [Candidatus Aegiribacteria sp.]|nr:hypothetical protein [Candidatus Aegiribacteria sp.]
MKYFFRCGLFCLFSISMIVSSQGTEVPWDLSWPFFDNAPSPHGVFNGYGDWCVIEEGPHPGLDFAADSGDSVIVPTGINMVSLGAKDFGAANGGCAMAIAPSIAGDPPYWGWGLLHLDIEHPEDPPYAHNSSLSGRQLLAPCLQYYWPGGVPAPLHLHLAWTECDVDPDFPYVDIVPIGPFEGYYNPFEYFSDILSGYDEIQFKKALYEGMNNTGAWFMPDGTETAGQISGAPGNPDYAKFQDIVCGAIDIAVSPFSAFQGLSDRDSAGVYSVSYEILRQDPISLQYVSAAPDTGNFGLRWLMEMRNEALPYGDSPGYRAIFLDGNLTDGTTPTPTCTPGDNSYIVTNSGALDPANWITGWDNV